MIVLQVGAARLLKMFRKHMCRKEVKCTKCGELIKVGDNIYTRFEGSKSNPIIIGDYCHDCAKGMGGW
jgi:hypothetical protein